MCTHSHLIQLRLLLFKMSIKLQVINMNPLDWRKAATLVTQHKQEAAMAEMEQLSSMPLSQIATDDGGLPIVHYGTQMLVASTFSEKGDQECPGHNFLMSRYAVRYVSSKSEA